MHILCRTEPLWLLNPPKLVYPEDPVLRRKQSNKVYAVKCQEDSRDLYIKETKQPPAKQMAQRRRTNLSGQDLAVYLYLQASGYSFNHEDVQIMHREECWFKQRVKEACLCENGTTMSEPRGGHMRGRLNHSPTLCEQYPWPLVMTFWLLRIMKLTSLLVNGAGFSDQADALFMKLEKRDWWVTKLVLLKVLHPGEYNQLSGTVKQHPHEYQVHVCLLFIFNITCTHFFSM